ncbi:MAG: DUF6020 family protein [Eubacteriales bacterium]|nr:DUF6020 family protein [Eubacteriales bacterium]
MQPIHEPKKPYRLMPILLSAVAGILCAKAFVINPQLFVGKASIPAESTDYVWTFVALALAGLFYVTYVRLRYRPGAGELGFGLLFGALNYFGTTLFAYDSWAFIGVFQSWVTVALKIAGQGATMAALLTLASHALLSRPLPQTPPRAFGRLRGFFARHTTLACVLLFVLCWSPYLIVFYPGTVISDLSWMFEQLQGITQMTTWHSVFTTWVFGACIALGRWIGGDNIGTLVYMLLQTFALAYACARVVTLVRRLGTQWKWQVAVLAFFTVLPIWGGYSMMIGKDTLYTATLLLLLINTVEWSRGLRVFRLRQWLAYGLLALLACLWRNNGFYVVLLSLLAFIPLARRAAARVWLAGIAAFVTAAVSLLNFVVVPALGIVDNTASGIYSVCFQQTARVVRDHADELTAEETAEIDRVLDIEAIGRVYQPWISDPVKLTYRQFGAGADVEKAALARYRKTWFSMMLKYPVTYLQAFMAGNRGYYAFTPKYTGITYSQQAGLRFVYTSFDIEGEGELHTVQPEAFAGLRLYAAKIMEGFRTIPIIQLLFTCAFYTWLLVGAALATARRRRWRELLLFVPALLSFAVCLVSPVDDYFRYFLPVVAMTIPLLACARHPGKMEVSGDAA